MKILHVENNAHDIELLGAVLKRLGHEVTAVDRISHGIEELSASRFDLVICDGTLDQPGDGVKWAEQLAREQRAVLVLSEDCQSDEVIVVRKWDAQQEPILLALAITDAVNKVKASS